ncbi:multiheme c-type cytochrome [Ferrimonas marina]|nr:multiheme c-type cytochrome [Ferrimonas marina]
MKKLISSVTSLMVAGALFAGAPAVANTDAKNISEQPPRDLLENVVYEKEYWEFLLENHPVFQYEKEGRLIGNIHLSDRQEEFIDFRSADVYAERHPELDRAAVTYRLGKETFLDFPNKYVGPKTCGECHPAQYEKWTRSRHANTLRFPDEMVEIEKFGLEDLNSPVFPEVGPASILPEGVTADAVYAVIGTPRTKYGFLDAYLVRGTYHVRDGLLSEGTGTIVAGTNQFSRGWAESITPEVAKQIASYVEGFPTTIEEFAKKGTTGSDVWGVTSYGSNFENKFMFQPASSYCEVCHTMKFNFANKDEFFDALGDAKKLQDATISRGISCEECHGAGGHMVDGNGGGMPSNCERCHQRFVWNEVAQERDERNPFNSYFKSSCPSCGTEGSQMYFSEHYSKGMRCTTCHDPHEVTKNDWTSNVTYAGMKKTCEDCHSVQAEFYANSGKHQAGGCRGCHMPNLGSCENFATIQFPDQAGFDNVRASHIWNIKVDKDAKTLNPPEGEPRENTVKGWTIARDDNNNNYLDLMWSCGRTAFADASVLDGGGCHSPVQSKLPKSLHFENQEQVYERVMKWQTPVKDGYDHVRNTLKQIDNKIGKANLTNSEKAKILGLARQARDIADKVEKDGAWGAHGARYTQRLMDEAVVYVDEAAALMKL